MGFKAGQGIPAWGLIIHDSNSTREASIHKGPPNFAQHLPSLRTWLVFLQPHLSQAHHDEVEVCGSPNGGLNAATTSLELATSFHGLVSGLVGDHVQLFGYIELFSRRS